jgi:hypothetical protein
MGLRQRISEWVSIIKDALDLGPEFSAAVEARRVMFAREAARLQHLLEQTQKASQEKDELIARLRAAGAVIGNMVVDGPAYYIRRTNTLDGPFCTSCFQRNHEIVRLASAPRPKDAGQTPADWVQCARCKTPFRSDRISQYLNPGKATGPDDKRQKTEDKRPETELQSPLSSDHESEPKPPQSKDSTLRSPNPDVTPAVENAKPASALTAVSPEEDDARKPAKMARKPRRKPKCETLLLGEVSTGDLEPAGKDSQSPQVMTESPSRTRPRTRKPRNPRPAPTKTADRPGPA